MSESRSTEAASNGNAADATPYRTPPPPCEACEAFKASLKKLEPFKVEGQRLCPECLSADVRSWKFICSGSGTRRILHRGFWFFGWRDVVYVKCPFEGRSARHFHLVCGSCQHRWMMRTASAAVTGKEG